MKLTGYEKPLDEYSKNELVQIAKIYTPYYQTASGIGKLSGYDRLTKELLINIIKVDISYIEANPKLPRRIGGPAYNKSKSKSLRDLQESLFGLEKPEELMDEILSRLRGSERPLPPVPGRYYTYIYYAKTPRIRYDRHPLIIVDKLLPRGFRGFNFHLGKYRQYNTQDGDRLVSGLYELSRDEFSILIKIKYGKIVQN